MSDNKHIYRFLRCFNRNKVMIVLSYLALAVNSFFVGIKTNNDEELKKRFNSFRDFCSDSFYYCCF